MAKMFAGMILASGLAACVTAPEMEMNAAADAQAPRLIEADAPHAEAPAPLSHFAPMIGRWVITDWSPNETGAWIEGSGADWDFAYVMDGWAVQDVWVKPGRATAVDDPSQRTIGTNVRLWDDANDRWKMSWIRTSAGEPQTWYAQSTAEEIVMTLTLPGQDAPRRRITFYDMTGETFDWRMEAAGEDGAWSEIYRIHGERP